MNMAGTSVIKQLPPKDLRTELRLFIAGVSKPATGSPLELIRKGFSLLKSLPASKDAVLEYFGTFYEKSVCSHMQELEVGNFNLASGAFPMALVNLILFLALFSLCSRMKEKVVLHLDRLIKVLLMKFIYRCIILFLRTPLVGDSL